MEKKTNNLTPLEYISNTIDNKNTILLFKNYYNLINNYQTNAIKNYKLGDYITLQKNSLIHGIGSFNFDIINSIKKHGFIFNEYFGNNVIQQKLCVCFWIVKNDIKLSDYILNYSGETIHYYNRFSKKNRQIYIPYNTDVSDRIKLFNKCNGLNNKIEFVRDSKESQFLPTLKKKDDYIAFVLKNDLTSKVLPYNIYTGNINKECLKSFLPNWVIKTTIEKRNSTRTDHEIALIYGLPSSLIEGCIVGKLIEKDLDKIKYIKDTFPNIYIANLDGKAI